MNPTPIDAVWRYCPWAIVAVSNDGKVSAVNSAFERCTGMTAETALGMSAADFAACVDALPVEVSRIETAETDLSALYFLRTATTGTTQKREVSRLTETLREPLASVYGFAELLLTQNYDEETRRDLTATLLEQVEAITNIINDQ
jgi:signal transduction histidine kinase